MILFFAQYLESHFRFIFHSIPIARTLHCSNHSTVFIVKFINSTISMLVIWFKSSMVSVLSLKSIGKSQFGFVGDLLQGETSCMMMVITVFVALAAPCLRQSCFDEEGSAADSNIIFDASVASLLLCYEFRAMQKVIQKWSAGLYKL